MLAISKKLADHILNSRNDRGKCDFGYICEHGAIIREAEFSVMEENGKYFLLHKSDLEVNGFLVRVKTTGGKNEIRGLI